MSTKSAPSATLSNTLRSGSSCSRSWSKYATSSPVPSRIVPESGASSPSSRRSSVVLPEPLGPMSPTRSPRMIVVVKSRHDDAVAAREAHVRAPRRRAVPSARASCAWSCTRADALAPSAALDAQRLERAHASLVPRASRLDAGADPDLLLRQLLVELRPLLLLRASAASLRSR